MGNKWLSERHVKSNYLILAVSVQLKSFPLYSLPSEKKPVGFKGQENNNNKGHSKGAAEIVCFQLSFSLLRTVPFILLCISF